MIDLYCWLAIGFAEEHSMFNYQSASTCTAVAFGGRQLGANYANRIETSVPWILFAANNLRQNASLAEKGESDATLSIAEC